MWVFYVILKSKYRLTVSNNVLFKNPNISILQLNQLKNLTESNAQIGQKNEYDLQTRILLVIII